MNSLLLIIELPKDLSGNAQVNKQDDLMKLCQGLSASAKRAEGIEEIPPNVWLLTGPNGLSFLRTALDLAGDNQLPARILSLDQEPNWIQGVASKMV